MQPCRKLCINQRLFSHVLNCFLPMTSSLMSRVYSQFFWYFSMFVTISFNRGSDLRRPVDSKACGKKNVSIDLIFVFFMPFSYTRVYSDLLTLSLPHPLPLTRFSSTLNSKFLILSFVRNITFSTRNKSIETTKKINKFNFLEWQPYHSSAEGYGFNHISYTI